MSERDAELGAPRSDGPAADGAGELAALDAAYGRATSRYYDLVYEQDPQLAGDVAWYTGLARAAGAPVLELGCGTGRVLLEVAALGIPCTGLDASQAMLNALQAKRPPPTLRLVCAPMQAFALGDGERFGLIYSAFRAFQHLCSVEDQLACLRAARAHLAPGGVLSFDVFCPNPERMGVEAEPEVEDKRFRVGEREIVRHTRVSRDPVRQVMEVRMRYVAHRDGQPVEESESRFEMRWFWRFELEHLLARAGFDDVHIHGDFEGGPVTHRSRAYVVEARVSRAAT